VDVELCFTGLIYNLLFKSCHKKEQPFNQAKKGKIILEKLDQSTSMENVVVFCFHISIKNHNTHI
jgi:hypothetical protein